MTTPRDLLIVAMDMEGSRPVEQGDLSLALAGAELIDLLAARSIRLHGDDIVPGDQSAPADRLLDEAAAALVRTAPYESVADWLWRRGRGLSAAYQAALEAEGQLIRQRRTGISFRAGQLMLADSPARRLAADRWTSEDPAFVALAEAVGVRGERTGDSPEVTDDAVATVLAAVNDALVELASVRQRRAIENAAFDNIWRGGAG
ncbi:GPP34 family phosphoprotein [Streptomyces sp. ISL-66]|uniref:GOLPH3/VPS74 family protein n=1 Tax=Streptomyces sp. ISL-66 TaxID=2819186 RepID=UPI001BE8CD56|nr:GPP34 family phosphoprotein [Streptomyces sp. ISL-66]MBT2471268.1 GPP34 family phosphoprotein [Streptomyces sp. ISL-66]